MGGAIETTVACEITCDGERFAVENGCHNSNKLVREEYEKNGLYEKIYFEFDLLYIADQFAVVNDEIWIFPSLESDDAYIFIPFCDQTELNQTDEILTGKYC